MHVKAQLFLSFGVLDRIGKDLTLCQVVIVACGLAGQINLSTCSHCHLERQGNLQFRVVMRTERKGRFCRRANVRENFLETKIFLTLERFFLISSSAFKIGSEGKSSTRAKNAK